MKKSGPKTAEFAPHEALQWGMNVARKLIWKHMTPVQKARHLLKKALKPLGEL